jgi:hypothetical protein
VTTTHTIHRSVTEDGWRARCSCGWTTQRRMRELRDRDADTHQHDTATRDEKTGRVFLVSAKRHHALDKFLGTAFSQVP